MCGIAGSINHALDIPKLTAAMYHRGPDEQNTFVDQSLILHHHRLAILDITAGQQPMSSDSLTIVFNGEIYNHLHIRKQLGLVCNTQSDTETILKAYQKKGPECLSLFDGMFALAIYDKAANSLFLARDRAGKKPLYYYTQGNTFVFASELNALRSQLALAPNEAMLQQYVQAAYIYKTGTPYQNVMELPAGCYAQVPLNAPVPEVVKWWNIHDYYQQKSTDSFEVAVNKVDQLLHAAVKCRVESSDLEVGSFLSGGIDSGLVTAIAKEYNPTLQTFTISFEGEYDEAPLAAMVAKRYNTRHHQITIGFDHLKNDIEKILFNYGEPIFDSSVIPSYYVSEAAKKHLTVILNGDGGDEIFGGYRRYVPFAKYDFFKKSFFIKNAASLLHSVMPISHNKKSKYNYLYRLTDFAKKQGIHTYFSSCLDVFEGYEEYLNVSDDVLQSIINDFEKITNSTLTGLQKMLNLDFDHILSSNLLVKMDIATMAHSLEGRSPLLAKGILEYVPSLPDNYKVNGGQTKYLLRKLAEKYLPSPLIHQPKRGFEIPLKKWIDGALKDLIAAYILSPTAYSSHFLKPGFIQQLWHRQIKMGDEKRAKMIWCIFALDVWYQKCYLKK
jgi:asparagine synthase (glutamine-hydrolysing)